MIITNRMNTTIKWFGKYNVALSHRWPETQPHELLGGRELVALANSVSVRIGANRFHILRIYDHARRWDFTGAPVIEIHVTWYTETLRFTYEFDTINPSGSVPLLDLVTAEVQKLPYEKVESELLHQTISCAIDWRKMQWRKMQWRKMQFHNRTA